MLALESDNFLGTIYDLFFFCSYKVSRPTRTTENEGMKGKDNYTTTLKQGKTIFSLQVLSNYRSAPQFRLTTNRYPLIFRYTNFLIFFFNDKMKLLINSNIWIDQASMWIIILER